MNVITAKFQVSFTQVTPDVWQLLSAIVVSTQDRGNIQNKADNYKSLHIMPVRTRYAEC